MCAQCGAHSRYSVIDELNSLEIGDLRSSLDMQSAIIFGNASGIMTEEHLIFTIILTQEI